MGTTLVHHFPEQDWSDARIFASVLEKKREEGWVLSALDCAGHRAVFRREPKEYVGYEYTCRDGHTETETFDLDEAGDEIAKWRYLSDRMSTVLEILMERGVDLGDLDGVAKRLVEEMKALES